MSTDIATARKQSVFAVEETTAGTLVLPSPRHNILPAGDAVMNQAPAFVDSMEKRDSLDVLDQFEDSMPAGTWDVPTYMRVSATTGSEPQAAVMWKSLMGSQISSSLACYATYATSTGVFFKQTTSAPSFSLFVKTDHFLQAMSGCTTNQCTVGLSNSGAVNAGFSGQGMQMYWAGQDIVSNGATVAASATTFQVVDADRFSKGIWIYNSTKLDSHSGAGYKISGTNATLNVLTVATALATAWSVDDVVEGYLPAGRNIGTALEGEDTLVYFNDVAATFRNTDLTISSPKQYLTDEVGTSYPAGYVEDTRQITSTLNLYFRKADAKYFAEGYNGNTIPVKIRMGQGSTYCWIHMQKVRLQVPSITFQSPTVALSMPMTALGTNGEDSCEVIFCQGL